MVGAIDPDRTTSAWYEKRRGPSVTARRPSTATVMTAITSQVAMRAGAASVPVRPGTSVIVICGTTIGAVGGALSLGIGVPFVSSVTAISLYRLMWTDAM